MIVQKKLTLLGILCGLGTSILLLIWVLHSNNLIPVKTSAPSPTSILRPSPSPTPTPDPLRPRMALLLGYVGGTHEGGLLTDTMVLAQANFKSKQLTLISIPRDLWVTIPLRSELESTSAGKINQVYALGTDAHRKLELPERYHKTGGGLLIAQDVVSQVINQPIDYTMAVNQAGFITALTKLGPIPVRVPYSFIDDFFPIPGEENNLCEKPPEEIATLSATLHGFELEKQFVCRYEKLEFTAGLQELDASTAAKFVRSRHANIGGSDFGRSLRQQALLAGIKTLFSQPTNWLKIPSLVTTLYKNVETTLELPDLLELFGSASNPESRQINSYKLDKTNALWESRSSNGQYILVDRAASGSAQLNDESWPTLRKTVGEWLTQTPERVASPGGSLDDQAP